ncbi:MAG: GNAT family N-acetyltransferase [Gemmatimonadetes bacterium]|nr:GNAT family N-acetyltransferase [Gemmatimonadota bacterium]
MPADAIPLLAEDIGSVFPALPAVLGPAPETSAFAALWAEGHGVRASAGQRQRIYQLERLVPPSRPARGALRLAQRADRSLVAEWIGAFSAEVGTHEVNSDVLAADRIAAKSMFLWIDGDPVSLAGWTGRSPNGIRVGPVYTPPQFRGRGYASAAVAAVTRRALDGGVRFCFLYTDLANPTSNAIYQRLGYEPVCDVMDWRFD